MRSIIFFLFALACGTNCFSQRFALQIKSTIDTENQVIDSLQYVTKHIDINSVFNEVKSFNSKLAKIGYLESKIADYIKKNDTTIVQDIQLGTKTKTAHLFIGNKPELKKLLDRQTKHDSIIIPFVEIELLMNKITEQLEKKGFTFAKLQLQNIYRNDNSLYADLIYDSGTARQLSAIVIKQNNPSKKNRFPSGHLQQMTKKYQKEPFTKTVVQNIRNNFDKFRFVGQTKPPEILFTSDSTNVYVYLEKRKSNNFDGVVGFTNSENNRIVFNGYLDFLLENAIQAGEQFSLYWKSDGNNQKTFRTSIDLPYVFNSPIGVKSQLNIFKQDSTFQNTKTSIELGYLFDYNSRLYLGYQATESSNIANTLKQGVSAFNNSFITLNFEYFKIDPNNNLFLRKTIFNTTTGIGSRLTNDFTEKAEVKQFYAQLNLAHNFYINKKNCFNVNLTNYVLLSDDYIINELYRFGGIKSIRGFEENSLQANILSGVASEYRYIAAPSLYFHTILDFGYFEDITSNFSGKLLGLGLGLGVSTNNGILKFNLSNGSINFAKLLFSKSIFSINYSLEF